MHARYGIFRSPWIEGTGLRGLTKDHDGDTYRAVCTVRMAERIHVLHAFQKKPTKGIRTPKREIDLVNARLKEAERMHRDWLAERGES